MKGKKKKEKRNEPENENKKQKGNQTGIFQSQSLCLHFL
jgi:hypothetical protein